MENPLESFVKSFSENKFWTIISKHGKKAGMKVIYMALLLFYAYRRSETPSWAKNIVLGALGYLISPFDVIPDLSPVLGFTDDAGVLAFGLVVISAYINSEVKANARLKLNGWFGQIDEKDLDLIDEEYS